MNIVVKIIGIVLIFMAILYLLKPDVIKKIMEFFKQGYRIYFIAVTRLTLAVIFLLAAGQCKKPWVIIALGIVFIISALLIFMLGAAKVKKIIDWWQRQPSLFLRIAALIVLALGVIIIYSA